jgi:Domain of unknown function (DUF4333)
MVKTVAILAFIGAAGAGATALAMKKTVIDGKVMAADLMKQLEKKGITDVTCAPEIPIGAAGATFTCKVAASDGSTANIEYTMNRAGALSAKLLESAGPTHQQVPATSDPWNN